MTRVFFGGSRKIGRLNAEVRKRVQNVIESGFQILIGDANGADKALQEYLAEQKYLNVTVYCSGHLCRNNIGSWKTEYVASDRVKKDFEHYARKDAQMGRDAEYGFFLWDGKSRGTLSNVFTLMAQNKKAVVYFSPTKGFVTVRSTRDLEELITRCDPGIAQTIRRRLSSKTDSKEQSRLDFA